MRTFSGIITVLGISCCPPQSALSQYCTIRACEGLNLGRFDLCRISTCYRLKEFSPRCVHRMCNYPNEPIPKQKSQYTVIDQKFFLDSPFCTSTDAALLNTYDLLKTPLVSYQEVFCVRLWRA